MTRRACEDCQRRSGGAPWNRFDPACFACGAAYLRALRSAGLARRELTEWTAHVLKTWSALGHNESALLSAAGG